MNMLFFHVIFRPGFSESPRLDRLHRPGPGSSPPCSRAQRRGDLPGNTPQTNPQQPDCPWSVLTAQGDGLEQEEEEEAVVEVQVEEEGEVEVQGEEEKQGDLLPLDRPWLFPNVKAAALLEHFLVSCVLRR